MKYRFFIRFLPSTRTRRDNWRASIETCETFDDAWARVVEDYPRAVLLGYKFEEEPEEWIGQVCRESRPGGYSLVIVSARGYDDARRILERSFEDVEGLGQVIQTDQLLEDRNLTREPSFARIPKRLEWKNLDEDERPNSQGKYEDHLQREHGFAWRTATARIGYNGAKLHRVRVLCRVVVPVGSRETRPIWQIASICSSCGSRKSSCYGRSGVELISRDTSIVSCEKCNPS